MSTVGATFAGRLKLIAVIGVSLGLIAACSSNALTCAEGNTSSACRISGGTAAGETTGSVQPPRASVAPVPAQTAPPTIARPATVPSPPQQSSSTIIAQPANPGRTSTLRPRRVAAECDATGSIPASPSAARPATSVFAHTVAPGETLYAIARRYKASPEAIARLNNIEHTPRIRSGIYLWIPAS
jgi:LysM repeat protein